MRLRRLVIGWICIVAFVCLVISSRAQTPIANPAPTAEAPRTGSVEWWMAHCADEANSIKELHTLYDRVAYSIHGEGPSYEERNQMVIDAVHAYERATHRGETSVGAPASH